MDLKNQAVVLVRAGVAKKVGRPNYSSYEANLQIEMSVDLGMVTDERFPGLVGSIYERIQSEVDKQIAEEVGKEKPAAVQSLPTPPKQELPHNDLSLAAEEHATLKTFGDFLRARAGELGQPPELLVKFWYKLFADGSETEFQKQGKILSDLWKAGSIGVSICDRALTNFPQF